MEQALHLFAAKGYNAVSVQQICETAGVTKPTLYHYFHSKVELFQAILDTYHTILWEQLDTFAYTGNIAGDLENFARIFFTFALEQPDFFRVQLALVFAPKESEEYSRAMDILQKHTILLEQFFLRASQDHGNMIGRQKIYAFSFQGMINNLITLLLGSDIELSDTLIRSCIHQFMHGIFS